MRRLRAARVEGLPDVLHTRVTEGELERAVATGEIRGSGGPLLFDAARGRAREAGSVALRLAAREAACRGCALEPWPGGGWAAARVPLDVATCRAGDALRAGARCLEGAGGVVVSRGRRPRVLLLGKVERGSERWVLPKGRSGWGETRAETARREVLEETGLRFVELGPPLAVERYFDVDPVGVAFKRVAYFLMYVGRGAGEVRVCRDEGFTTYRWATFAEALELTSAFRAGRALAAAAAATGAFGDAELAALRGERDRRVAG